jgi:hypothetical protein
LLSLHIQKLLVTILNNYLKGKVSQDLFKAWGVLKCFLHSERASLFLENFSLCFSELLCEF